MKNPKNLLALDGVESLLLTREEWRIVDLALSAYIALSCLRMGVAPKQEMVQSVLRRIRSLWFEDRHEKRTTGFCRVCGHYGRDCSGRQRPRRNTSTTGVKNL